MLHIIGLIFIITKGVAFILTNEVLCYLDYKNVIFFILLSLLIIFCKKLLRYRKIHHSIEDHLIHYRFKNRKEYYYSIIIVVFVLISYTSIIFYLRLNALNKPLDLKVLYILLIEFYGKMSKGILCYNLFIFVLVIYFILLVIKLFRKQFNILITKIHFYLLSFERYIIVHNGFRNYFSIDAVFIHRISTYYSNCEHYIFCLYLFGYYKKKYYFCTKNENTANPNKKKDFWTREEKKLYNDCFEKYCWLSSEIDLFFKHFFYNLHFLLLIIFVLYDVVYNNLLLTHVSQVLPLLFIYQIYVLISKFVQDKITYNVSIEISSLYYKDITEISTKYIMIDDNIYQRPNINEIVKEFLEYEAVEFYNTRLKH